MRNLQLSFPPPSHLQGAPFHFSTSRNTKKAGCIYAHIRIWRADTSSVVIVQKTSLCESMCVCVGAGVVLVRVRNGFWVDVLGGGEFVLTESGRRMQHAFGIACER